MRGKRRSPKMIKIQRGEPPKDNKLDRRRKKELQKIRKAVSSGESYRFEPLWSDPKVKKFLHKSQHGKCCYCERKRDERRESDVEHFRPKAEVEGAKNHQGYWWLAYNWENLLIACKKCNQDYKKSKFPLRDESKRVCGENSNLGKEEPILINPLEEDPEEFIEYNFCMKNMVKAVGKCERGRRTVNELTGINDMEVMKERAKKIRLCYRLCALFLDKGESDELRAEAERCLREYISSSSPFSGFARFYFKKKGYLSWKTPFC